MRHPTIITAFALATLIVPVAPTGAQGQVHRQERVVFAAGSTSATIEGTIRGNESIDYLVERKSGQPLAVTMTASNASAYFNILPQGARAMHIGSIAGNEFAGMVPATGDYAIRVHLMRDTALQDEETSYVVTISTAEPPPDYADGLSGAPDFWRVVVPKGDELNVRAAPSARAPIVGRLTHGTVLPNGGCRMNGSTRWCRVEMPDGGPSGWAAGRYLRE
jgi:hypothetical protein